MVLRPRSRWNGALDAHLSVEGWAALAGLRHRVEVHPDPILPVLAVQFEAVLVSDARIKAA